MNNIVKCILGCQKGEFPIKYLDNPIKLGKLKREDWRTFLEKFNKRLEG